MNTPQVNNKPIVLLADDDTADQEIFRRLVEQGVLRAELKIARSGEEALELLEKDGRTPDLILLDLNMPGFGGHETLIKLRKTDATRTTPVIVLTTSDSETDIIKSYELGANSFITKPISFEEFARVVREVDEYWFDIIAPSAS
jgi:CheY-like chemotaxis protein